MLELNINSNTSINYNQAVIPNANCEDKFLNHILQNLPKHFFSTAFSSLFKVRALPSKCYHHIYKWRSDNHRDERHVDELRVLKLISQAIYRSKAIQILPVKEQYLAYEKVMIGAYKGDHLLLSDNEAHMLTEEFTKCGAIIRGSSHNEKGREITGWNEKGAPIFGSEMRSSLLNADVNHYGLTGNHIKHILFYSADMMKCKDGSIIPAMTVRELNKRMNASKNEFVEVHGKQIRISDIDTSKVHHYVALQFESSPDSEGNNFKDPLFWKHRLTGFVQYRLIKKFNALLNKILFQPITINANVGPYGYGRTDLNPVILESV